ncbi:glycosyltransferase [Segetibacter aerophilus]|nr:glycosyltransferase [Segetibacter aerophilus]
MDKHLHIVCLNVPYPVNYGGVFDLFYKLSALQQNGVKIHLHCFEYGRGEQPTLNKYCASVNYYQREKGLRSLSISYPFIVKSRNSKKLLESLSKDNYPILMEGIHCTYLLNDKRFTQRKCFVRLHNVEHVYYRHLACFTKSAAKKLYMLWESYLLKRYEKKIVNKATFLTVTERDADLFKKLGCKNATFVPLFLPDWKLDNRDGKGSFCLYHGDLSVAENEQAAIWLLEKVFNDLAIPFVVAGKNPPQNLIKLAHSKNSTCLIANPGEQEMQDLITKAHINIIPSYNSTGIKLKLLNALYNGRHCLVNEATIEGTGLEAACNIASTEQEFKNAITELYDNPFPTEEIQTRKQLLENVFNSRSNAIKIVEAVWGKMT